MEPVQILKVAQITELQFCNYTDVNRSVDKYGEFSRVSALLFLSFPSTTLHWLWLTGLTCIFLSEPSLKN